MTKSLDGEELDKLIHRMKEIQFDYSLPISVRTAALKIEVHLLQMDIDLLLKGVEKHEQNLRDSG